MPEQSKTYVCAVCGAEVAVLKKTVADPQCPTLTCCGQEMEEKGMKRE
jgi:DNA-directed RNA polymerase subunit RPC12/RpoP